MSTNNKKKRQHSPKTEDSTKKHKSYLEQIVQYVSLNPGSLSCAVRIFGHSGLGHEYTKDSRSVEFPTEMTITSSAAIGYPTCDWRNVDNIRLRTVDRDMWISIVFAYLIGKRVYRSVKIGLREAIEDYYNRKLDILREELRRLTSANEAENMAIQKQIQEIQAMLCTSKDTYKTFLGNSANDLLTIISSANNEISTVSFVFIADKHHSELEGLLLNAWNDYTSETNLTIFDVYKSQIIHCSEESPKTNYLNKESFAYKLIRELSLAKHSSEPYFPRNVNNFSSFNLIANINKLLQVNTVFKIACAEIYGNNPKQISSNINKYYENSDDESTPGGTRKAQTLSLRVSKKRLRKTRRKRSKKTK
jgi:hypothetical protein